MLLILLAYALTFQRVYALLAATKCPPVHVIAARASMEAPGEGVMGSLATCVKNSISAATSEGLNYPAAVDDYLASAANGTANLMKSVTAFVQQCPEAKLVLLGYSQGAHVVGDVLCGGAGGPLGVQTPPLAPELMSKIPAIIQMGDPRYTANTTYDVGKSTKGGAFARLPEQIKICDNYASKIQSYCNAGDPFCDSGDNTAAHLSYTKDFNTAAFRFILAKLGKTVSGECAGSDMPPPPGL